MAVVDYGSNHFTVTISGTTSSNPPPVQTGGFYGAIFQSTLPPAPPSYVADFGPNNLTVTLSGTTASMHCPVALIAFPYLGWAAALPLIISTSGFVFILW